ncbi:ABC transporter [Paenibacillus alvei]|uniref:ABC transporter n=1 Tax=Paenibacillus alvei TaxID=44250 RepID=A0A383R3N3_PAEAL|nr:ABC transporter [Paenibacillus alvei]
MDILEIEHLSEIYGKGESSVKELDGASFSAIAYKGVNHD